MEKYKPGKINKKKENKSTICFLL